MKRAVAKALLQVGGAVQHNGVLPALQQAASLVPEGTRCLSSSHPETPLSKILPPIVALPRQIIGTALSLTGKLVSSAASSGAAKSVVTSFAEEVLLKEQFVKLSELDVAYWTYWLASTGYTSQGGYKKLAEAAKAALPGLEAQQVASLVEGMHMAKYTDKALLDEVARHISANFTKYETEDLLKILSALHDFGYYSRDLYDDIGDSIAYANHYLAPLKAPTDQVAKALATYAKFGHERADVMVTLARGISELGLSKLSQAARGEAVATALQALHTFHFYPEQVDALLYFTSEEPELFSGEQLKLADAVRAAVEAQTGGKLAVYKTNDDEDAAHWYGHHTAAAPAHHELFVLRESLVPKAYSPAALRPK
ncbi:mitochondrial F1F0 ATP synthase associated 36.3 kDa protein [Haematococcus lacustris]